MFARADLVVGFALAMGLAACSGKTVVVEPTSSAAGQGGAAGATGSGGSGGQLECAHDECVVGGPLYPQCSGCAYAICEQDDYCCLIGWDQGCVDLVGSICFVICEG